MAHARSGPLSDQDVSYRAIFAIALPMIAAYISVPLIGIVDMTVVGHLDDARYIGGVSVGALFFSTAYFIFFFLRWSTTGLTAQLFGQPESPARDRRLGETLARALLLALVSAVAIVVLHRPALSLVLDAMDAAPGVREQALAYSAARVSGAPAVLAAFALTGWFIGAAEARSVLTMTILANILNAGLSVVFVFALGMKARGCGLAAAIGDWASLLFGGAVFLRRHAGLARGLSAAGVLDPAAIVSLLRSNLQIAVKLVTTIAIMYGFAIAGGRLGTVVLAANALLLQLFYFASYVLDGFANACEALSGRAYGSGDEPRLRLVIARCGRCALAVGTGFAALYLLAGQELLGWMSSIGDVREAARQYLPAAAMMPPAMALAVMYEGIFVGTMRTEALRNCAVIAAVAFLALLWPAIRVGGNHGLWLLFAGAFLLRQTVARLVYLPRIAVPAPATSSLQTLA